MELTHNNPKSPKTKSWRSSKKMATSTGLASRSFARSRKMQEQLRENLSFIVRQSAALNRLGAENMKPRQLSDATYQEVRSSDGMSSEISETVRSVYNRLMERKGISNMVPVQKHDGDRDSVLAQANGVDHVMSDISEPNEPPGFLLLNNHPKNESEDSQPSFRHEKVRVEEQQKGPSTLLQVKQVLSCVDTEHKQAGECSDEDPDVPPGLG